MATRSRFFSDYYDSTKQRLLFPRCKAESGPTDDPRALFLGRMRFDTLLTQSIVLTDAQVFDGAFFLSAADLGFLDKLRRLDRDAIPIEIRGRSSTVEECVLGFVRSSGATLRPFSFSSIADAQARRMVAEELASRPSSEVSSLEDLSALLKSIGVDAGNVDHLYEGWRKWGEATSSVRLVRWSGQRDPMAFRKNLLGQLETLRSVSVVSGFPAQIREDIAALIQVFGAERDDKGVLDRSRLDVEYLGRFREKYHDNPRALIFSDQIFDAFNTEYHASIARQHGCDVTETVFSNALDDAPLPLPATQPPVDNARDEVPPALVAMLAQMSTEEYRHHFLIRETSFRRWWEHGESKALKMALEPMLGQVRLFQPEPSLAWSRADQFWAVGVRAAAGAAGAAVTAYAAGRAGDPVGAAALGSGVKAMLETLAPASLEFLRRSQDMCHRVLRVVRKRGSIGQTGDTSH